VGKRADLILLEDNPLDDISHIRNRAGVMLRGQWFTETQLQDNLYELVESFRPGLIDRIWPLSLIGAAGYMIFIRIRKSAREQSDG
jgi:hypothetical protein